MQAAATRIMDMRPCAPAADTKKRICHIAQIRFFT